MTRPAIARHCLSLLIICLLLSCSTIRQEALPEATYATASWYGSEFHGRPTSSGEIFNMYARTCAHRDFPFGTRLQVTDVSNKKTVECVVNDRGPFVGGRDIDLSYAAAKEIGLIGRGTGRVLVQVSGRDESYIRRVKVQTSEKNGPFAIQVGSFTESSNAVRLKEALGLTYGNVYIQEAEIKGATYFRVRIGNYMNYDSAFSVADRLGREGYPTILLKAETKI